LRKFIILFVGCALLGGCAKVSHLDQLLVLKDLADEQTALNKYIEKQDQNFNLMLKEVKAGTLDQHSTKKKMRKAFGDPVFTRPAIEDDQELDVWLYRYSTKYFGAEKVYLYFDLQGNLIKSEYIEGKDGESGEETAPENGSKEI